jgi:hypothetical protein
MVAGLTGKPEIAGVVSCRLKALGIKSCSLIAL